MQEQNCFAIETIATAILLWFISIDGAWKITYGQNEREIVQLLKNNSNCAYIVNVFWNEIETK